MMKRIILLLLTGLLAAALCACSGQPSQDDETQAAEQAAEENSYDESLGIANPITEYASLEEINEITRGSLCRPPVMGVTDESYSVIDCGDYKVAQYDFSVNGIPYCYRFANGVVEDISGIYENGGTLFDAVATDVDEVKAFDGGKAARHFNIDGQYVISVKDDGALDEETFRGIADELFSLTAVADSKSFGLDAFIGNWYEQIAGRGLMTVTADGDKAVFNVEWANSASEVYRWEFAGYVNEEGVIEYTDGRKYSAVFDQTGNETVSELSATNSGSVRIDENGDLLWIDDESAYTEGSVFVKY